MTARPFIAPALAALLLATAGAHAQTFRCQFPDGHVEYRGGTCPYGVAEKNVGMPGLAPAAAPASASTSSASVPAPAPARKAAASALTTTHFDEPGPDGRPPATWGLVDVDYGGVSVGTLFDKLAGLVGKKAVVDASVRGRTVTAHYHDIPWDEAVADIATRAGLAVRDDGQTLVVTRGKGGATAAKAPASQTGQLRVGGTPASAAR